MPGSAIRISRRPGPSTSVGARVDDEGLGVAFMPFMVARGVGGDLRLMPIGRPSRSPFHPGLRNHTRIFIER